MNQLTGQIYGPHQWQQWSTRDELRIPAAGEFLVQLYSKDGLLQGAIRDPLGLMPGYYAFSEEGKILICHSLMEILKTVAAGEINWEYIYSIWADNYESNEHSPYKNIFRIPAGHLLFNDGINWKTRSFFSEIQSNARPIEETFEEVIQDRAHQDKKFALFLSGGFDSSLLLAMLQKKNFSPNCFGLAFEEGPASEVHAIAALKEKFEFQFQQLDGAVLPRSEFAWDPKDKYFYAPTLNLFKPLLKRAAQRGHKYIWTGLGADEVFCREASLVQNLMNSADIRHFLAQTRSLLRHPSQLVYQLFREFLPADLKKTWLSNLGLHTDFNIPEVHQLALSRRKKRLGNFQRYRQKGYSKFEIELRERISHNGIIAFSCEQEQALAGSFGLQMSYPYLDLRLISCALDRPHSFFFGEGLDKYGLRQTFKNILPAEISMRTSSQDYDAWMHQQLMFERSKIKQWISDSQFEGKMTKESFLEVWNEQGFKNQRDRLLKLLYSFQLQEKA